MWNDGCACQNRSALASIAHFCHNILFFYVGKYRERDEERISPLPTAVCDDFSAAVELVLSSNHHQTYS